MSRIVTPEEQMHLRVQSLEKDLHTAMVTLSPKRDHFSLARDVQAQNITISVMDHKLERIETILDDICTRLEKRGI